MTALHWACKKGNLEMSKILLDHNAKMNIRDIVSKNINIGKYDS